MTRKRWRFIVEVRRFIKNKLLAEIRKKRHKKSFPLPLFLIALFIASGIISSPVFSQAQPANGQVLIEQGRKLYNGGELSTAVMILQQAADALRTQGDKLGEAIALSNLSLAFKQLGQWEKAEMAIAQSLQILTTSQNTPNSASVFAQTLEVQGNLQLELGKPELALNTWKQAENIYAKTGDEVGKTRSLINQSIAQQALGQYVLSYTTLEQMYHRLEKQPDSLVKATALRSLGDVVQLIGDLKLSLKVLLESRNIAEKLQSPPEISAALLSLGNIYAAFGNRESHQDTTTIEEYTPLYYVSTSVFTKDPGAIKFYQQAAQYYLEAANTSTSPLGQIQAQLNRLSMLLELQKWSQAQQLSSEIQLKLTKIPPSKTAISAQINLAQSLVYLKQTINADIPSWKEIAQSLATAIQQARSIDDKRSEAYGLGALGGLYLKTQDIPNAEKLTQQALIQAQAIKAQDIAYLWQWQLGQILKIKGDISGAIAFYTQAVDTLTFLRNDLISLNTDVQFSFRDNVEPVYRQLVDLLLQPVGGAGEGGTRGGGDKGRGRQGGQDAQCPLPNAHCPLPNAQFTVSQDNLKQARNVIEALQLSELENFFREACLQAKPKQIDDVVDKIDQTAAVIYPIILKDRIEIILKMPSQSQLSHYTTYKEAKEVELKLDKLGKSLREPDRINDVHKLSQELYSWLIKPLEVDLAKLKIKTLVFVLDGSLRNIPMGVLYDEKQKQYLIQKYAIALAPGLQLIDPKPLQRRELNLLIAGISEQRQIEGRSFAPLKNVELELDKVHSLIPKSQKLFNHTFTKINVQNKIKKAPFRVIHIATHGEFSSNADKTFILTWEGLLKVKDFDKLLRLRNPSDRAIELLVLSACQTASGDKRATLGLAGIAVRAGTRSTLATLWSVEDQSSAELMNQFYQKLAQGETKAEALRHAQLELLDKYQTPYFWVPYVLVGNWL
ncbi:CHAT domain-containing protein [Scytonema hofmannii FACHB-248]|uniref:CHAT domain-containing protein n=1 Tax=Scytonema hofmannii FACHB-248 TaxID=1842502 RepID=A0ABR8GQ20_9CYAN|nr:MULTISPECIES: CHAT domain-containing protein [Nostocales]MBD2605258.1 CHAT domain-containing protein [Scytonema hofmannii FACHB-248]